MRHQKKRHRLGRTTSHRKATLAALSNALIENKRTTTTQAKAKALRVFIEPLITRSKEDTTHNRRQVFRRLQDKESVTVLFDEISDKVGDRPGGYTRVVKLGRRAGDGAPLAMIELVDYNDVQPEGATTGRKRTRRGGGGGRKRRKPEGGGQERPQQPTASETKQSGQLKSIGQVEEAETVEEPVAKEQAVPVTERTEPGPSEETVDAARDVIEDQKQKAEGGEADAAEAEAPEAEAEAPKAEAEAEAPEAEAETEAPKAEAETEAPDAEAPEADAEKAADEPPKGTAESADETDQDDDEDAKEKK